MNVCTRDIRVACFVSRAVATALVLGALFGCSVGPNYSPPQHAASEQWPAALEGGLSANAADLRAWWRTFGDSTLNSLVDRALTGNLDLREAAARVREARALRGVTAADQLFSVDARGSASYSRASENTFGGPGGAPGEDTDLYDIGFDATWELDVFGRVRRSVEAAEADIDSAVESQRDAQVMLVAEVARNYAEYRSAQARLTIAQENVNTQQDTLSLTEDRTRAGISTELDVSRARAQLETTRSQVPTLTTALKRATFRLDVLLGQAPGTLATELESVAPVPPPPAAASIGLPAELLRRRPDIRRAERTLAAATARVGVAHADLYPRFRLLGSFGLASEDLGNLFDGDSRAWSAGPLSVRWPVFDAGRIRSGIKVQEARQEQAFIAYERRVLEAYEEVAGALVTYARVRDQRDTLSRAVAANKQAVDLANDLWKRGLTDFLSVLNTQRDLFQLQDQLAVSDAAVTTSLMALFKALGGGWDYVEGGTAHRSAPQTP